MKFEPFKELSLHERMDKTEAKYLNIHFDTVIPEVEEAKVTETVKENNPYYSYVLKTMKEKIKNNETVTVTQFTKAPLYIGKEYWRPSTGTMWVWDGEKVIEKDSK